MQKGLGERMNEQELQAYYERMKANLAYTVYNHFVYDEIRLDYSEMHLDIVPESRNPEGNVHGGCYFSMADSCAGAVARSDGHIYVSQSASCNWLRAASEGRIFAIGKTKRRGRTICVVDVDIFDEAKRLLFSATFSLFRVD
mgnify:CR=1 FL=1